MNIITNNYISTFEAVYEIMKAGIIESSTYNGKLNIYWFTIYLAEHIYRYKYTKAYDRGEHEYMYSYINEKNLMFFINRLYNRLLFDRQYIISAYAYFNNYYIEKAKTHKDSICINGLYYTDIIEYMNLNHIDKLYSCNIPAISYINDLVSSIDKHFIDA